jgi:hypothetical protein
MHSFSPEAGSGMARGGSILHSARLPVTRYNSPALCIACRLAISGLSDAAYSLSADQI